MVIQNLIVIANHTVAIATLQNCVKKTVIYQPNAHFVPAATLQTIKVALISKISKTAETNFSNNSNKNQVPRKMATRIYLLKLTRIIPSSQNQLIKLSPNSHILKSLKKITNSNQLVFKMY
jgi:hypothetical protein